MFVWLYCVSHFLINMLGFFDAVRSYELTITEKMLKQSSH